MVAVISAVDIAKEVYRYRAGQIDQRQLQRKSVGHVVRVSGSAVGGAAGAAVGGGMAAAAAAGGTYGATAGPAGAVVGGVLGAAAVGLAADQAYTTVTRTPPRPENHGSLELFPLASGPGARR